MNTTLTSRDVDTVDALLDEFERTPEHVAELDGFKDGSALAAVRHHAAQWHGGQWTALYALASTGALVGGLHFEAVAAWGEAERADDHEAAEAFEALVVALNTH